MAVRQIRRFGDDILRKKCKAVKVVDDKIRALLDDMADTMYNEPNGGGLAAPQIGVLKRLVVMDMGEGLIKLVNPVVIKSEGRQEVVEGCLSNPDVYGKLIRPYEVTVSALNEKGEPITLTGRGDLAKCICHELDHLEGVLFTDLVTEYIR